MGLTASKAKRLEELKKRLCEAAKSPSLEALQEIVNQADDGEERKELINSVDNRCRTILHIAAKHGHANIIEWILSEQGGRAAGFDSVLTKISQDQTALHIAAVEGHLEACKGIVNGCRVDHGERAEMLNAVTDQQCTVLHDAAERGHVNIIRWILSEEGRALGFNNVLARATDESTTLHHSRNLETFLAVVNGCRVENGERREMLNAVDKEGWTILHLAAFRNQPRIISWLLSDEAGGGAAEFDRSLITALTKAEKSSALHLAARSSVECIRALLSHCTQKERMHLFHVVDNRGWTALYIAAQLNCHKHIAQLFQYAECSVVANRRDNVGMTVLHRAIIGAPNKRSRQEWRPHFAPNPIIIIALLGSTEKGWTSIDPNIGLGLE